MAAVVSSKLASTPRTAQGRDRIFYTGMALAAALAVLLGFARSYYLRLHFDPTPLAPAFHVHGLVFSSWIALFIVQTSLVAAHRTHIHRKLGWVGAGLAVLMVIVAMSAAIFGGRRDIAAGAEDQALTFFATPVLSMVTFAILIATAVTLRQRPETHKRLMLLATLSLLDAAVARWPIPGLATHALAWYGVTDVFIVVAVLYDFASRRSVSPVYIWGGLFIVAGQAVRDVLGATPLWHAFATMILE